MIVDLDKSMLVSIIKGCYIDYHQMNIPLVSQNGEYRGGFNDRWYWTGNFHGCTEEQLWDLYQELQKPITKLAKSDQQLKKESDIEEIETILADGFARGCDSQVKAAQDELKRLRDTKV